ISHRQKQKNLIMLPSETMIWQPEFTDKTLSRKPGAVHATQAPEINNADLYDNGRFSRLSRSLLSG
ncbi:hypothetical protein ACM2L8_25505, partial [Escherichia coli]